VKTVVDPKRGSAGDWGGLGAEEGAGGDGEQDTVSCKARAPEPSIPRTCASEKSERKVLLTRPCISGGVAFCDSVVPGIITKAMEKPIMKVPAPAAIR
jgi:hypothetical protein